jgi:3-carboxy-cis,cis-muconate cycloisomerase
MVAAAKLLRDKSSAMLDAMMQDFERATGPWHVEWAVVAEAFLLLASSLFQAERAMAGLRVDAERMRANLGLTGGLLAAEAVMMALAPEIGRQHAHELVYAACGRVRDTGTELAAELRRDPAVTAILGDDRIDALCDPAGYLGSARAMVHGVVGVSAAE